MRHLEIDSGVADRLDAFAEQHDTTSANVIDRLFPPDLAETLTVLARMVRQLRRIGGYSTPDDQREVREAMDLLERYGIVCA